MRRRIKVTKYEKVSMQMNCVCESSRVNERRREGQGLNFMIMFVLQYAFFISLSLSLLIEK